jgi:hypothetical protein
MPLCHLCFKDTKEDIGFPVPCKACRTKMQANMPGWAKRCRERVKAGDALGVAILLTAARNAGLEIPPDLDPGE